MLGVGEGPAVGEFVGCLVDMGMKTGRSGNVLGADGLVEKPSDGKDDGIMVGMSVGVNVGTCDGTDEFVSFRRGTDLDDTTIEAALAVAPTADAATTPMKRRIN